MQNITVSYGKAYNEEMAQIVDRRTATRVWTFREFRKTYIAYRKDENTIVVLVDDENLDHTNAIVCTPEEFATYKNSHIGYDIENGNAPFGYQRQPITRR